MVREGSRERFSLPPTVSVPVALLVVAAPGLPARVPRAPHSNPLTGALVSSWDLAGCGAAARLWTAPGANILGRNMDNFIISEMNGD